MQDSAFNEFAHRFSQYVQEPGMLQPDALQKPTKSIRLRAGVYRTRWTQVSAIFFVAFDGIVIGAIVSGRITLSPVDLYRLLVVVLPGTAYVLHRAFRRWQAGAVRPPFV